MLCGWKSFNHSFWSSTFLGFNSSPPRYQVFRIQSGLFYYEVNCELVIIAEMSDKFVFMQGGEEGDARLYCKQ